MGCVNSKAEKNEALCLCKERKRFMKVANDSRYALAASHLSYIQSLRNVGFALRRYAEAEMLIESSMSVSDHSPSQSTYPSSSPSHVDDASESPLNNETHMSFMKSWGTKAVTVMINPHSDNYLNDVSTGFPIPPPPPESDVYWDFFDPAENTKNFGFSRHASCFEVCKNEEKTNSQIALEGQCMKSNLDEKDVARGNDYSCCENLFVSRVVEGCKQRVDREEREVESLRNGDAVKNECTEREDPSEFITHRAKDFLTSIRVIEHRFVRAFESGREVSRLLEAHKIKVGYSEAKGKLSALILLTAFLLVCCGEKATLVSQEPAQKIISWKRTMSSQSASIRNPLVATPQKDREDNESDFVEESCMISGSHSCTLDRLYAWERKLYDEVKASEFFKKEFDKKCDQLRHQFAKDQGTQVIDKTRSVAKDLHSRIIVAIYSVNLISKRIERMRDEELFPQLLELTQGLIRMWKAMLECHHAQYITISLAYHSRRSTRTLEGDTRKEIMGQLLEEFECLGVSFAQWINSHTSYIEALNGWLQNCILKPKERSKSKKPFSPRRALAPPIFVLCRDWSIGIKALPSEELTHSIKNCVSDLREMMEKQDKNLSEKQNSAIASTSGEIENKINEDNEDSSYLCCIHASLTKVAYQLTKFSEASLKMYEDIRHKSEAAQIAYHNCRSVRTGKF
ncbi:nitrate regulatory gene2 protein-like [Abrus precatorius]|uniref:Nitrate regulatory gene2 protein-like n=1 Tax=Abrus precatorius TaxID=3816 RepID=A0A8B8K1S2_ABRPR|nr:nitrate regulatory gene2 protein-like [Abrus precatorius]